MKKARILGVGIATMDMYCHLNKMYPGGNEYNIAYNAKLQGSESGFMGVFADDVVGNILEKTLKEVGVDTTYSHHEIGSSGYALVDIQAGERVFLDWNKQGVTDLYPFTFSDEEMEYMKKFDVTCISWGARVAPESIAKLAGSGIPICYDFYDNFKREDIKKIAPHIKFSFFSCSHLTEKETKTILKDAASYGCEIAIGTRGTKPALAYMNNQYYKQGIFEVVVKDTMGAGDSYISAFLMNYLSGETDEFSQKGDKIQFSLSEAAKFSATVVAKDGALGVGYSVDMNKLSDIINIKQEEGRE